MVTENTHVNTLGEYIALAQSYDFDEMYVYLSEDYSDVQVAIIAKDEHCLQFSSDKFYFTDEQKEEARAEVMEKIESKQDCKRLWYTNPELVKEGSMIMCA